MASDKKQNRTFTNFLVEPVHSYNILQLLYKKKLEDLINHRFF